MFKKIFFTLVLIVTFSVPCYASPNTYQEDIYSLSQYNTIQELLDDSSFKPSADIVNGFLNNNKYTRKYIISFCNSSYCEQHSNNRSIAMLGFSENINVNFTQNDRVLSINAEGPDDSPVFIYYNSGSYPHVNAEYDLSFFNNNSIFNTFDGFRLVLPCSNVASVNQLLPSMLFDNVFNDLKIKIKNIIVNNLVYILPCIFLSFLLPFLLWFFRIIRRSMR